MRFLVDNALSPEVAHGLAAAGHDAIHVRDLGIQHDEDEDIFRAAEREARALVSADTDFGTMLALRAALKPSVVLFRHGAARRPKTQVALLLLHMEELNVALEQGSLIVIEETRLRIRPLPLFKRN